MDTSEKYIEMCRKATEIQSKWRLDVLDYLYYPDVKEVIVWTLCDDNSPTMPDKPIWLLRQDQSQDMITLQTKFYLLSLNKFLVELARDSTYFYSWEQLWLAFVMDKNFGKRWNGFDWMVA